MCCIDCLQETARVCWVLITHLCLSTRAKAKTRVGGLNEKGCVYSKQFLQQPNYASTTIKTMRRFIAQDCQRSHCGAVVIIHATIHNIKIYRWSNNRGLLEVLSCLSVQVKHTSQLYVFNELELQRVCNLPVTRLFALKKPERDRRHPETKGD